MCLQEGNTIFELHRVNAENRLVTLQNCNMDKQVTNLIKYKKVKVPSTQHKEVSVRQFVLKVTILEGNWAATPSSQATGTLIQNPKLLTLYPS